MNRTSVAPADSVAHAVHLLVVTEGARVLAGGTNLIADLQSSPVPFPLIAIGHVPELRTLRIGGTLDIGSAVTVGRVVAEPEIRARWPALWEAAAWLGSVQVRNLATVGGNLCHASPAADLAPPLIAYGASAVVAHPGGCRTVAVEDLFAGPETTTLQRHEVLVALTIGSPGTGTGSAYVAHTPRSAMDVAVAAAAVSIRVGGDGRVAAVRVALGALGPTPRRARAVERTLAGRIPRDRVLEEAALRAADDADPIDDERASAGFRRHLAGVVTERALATAVARAEQAR